MANPFEVGDKVRVRTERKESVGFTLADAPELIITSVCGVYVRFFDEDSGWGHWCFERIENETTDVDYSAITRAIIGG